jgi:Ni/Fe-hydrogenase subunit HybB-like protein
MLRDEVRNAQYTIRDMKVGARAVDKPYRESELERTVLEPLRHTSMQFWLVIIALGALILVGIALLTRQWWLGLGVTGMSRPIYWGVYIINFVFFIGISHAGVLISAILRVTQAEWRRPITRIAEAIGLFALILGALQILIDLGRPERIVFPLYFGRYESPMLWDITCLTVYSLSCAVYLYLPMLPDLAYLRDHVQNVPPWRHKLYTIISLGWHGSHEQFRRLERAIGWMAVLIIPIAIAVHTVVSWIFGSTMLPVWHSPLLAPYFVVGAILAGIALLCVLMTIFRRVWHLENWIGAKQYNYLGILLLVMSAFWGYFSLNDFMTTGYGSLVREANVLQAKLFGEYTYMFYAMVFCNLILPFAILLWRKGRTPTGTFLASLAIIAGIWMDRFTIVTPTLARPSLGYERVIYTLSVTEIGISVGSVALFAMLFVLFFKLVPAISVWEVEKGEQVEPVRRRPERLMGKEEMEHALPAK